jgi:type VI protein secretion system component VasF
MIEESLSMDKLPAMSKRRPTFHQRRVWYFMIFFGVLGLVIFVGFLWLLNRLSPAGF